MNGLAVGLRHGSERTVGLQISERLRDGRWHASQAAQPARKVALHRALAPRHHRADDSLVPVGMPPAATTRCPPRSGGSAVRLPIARNGHGAVPDTVNLC